MQNRLHVGDLTGGVAAGGLPRSSASQRLVVVMRLPKSGKAGLRRAFVAAGTGTDGAAGAETGFAMKGGV